MAHLKYIIHLLDITFSGLWALIMVDLMPSIGHNSLLSSVDGWIKVAMSIAGFFYFVIRIFFFAQNQLLELQIKKKAFDKMHKEEKDSSE